MRGFKAFDENLQCRGLQYTVGGEMSFDGKPIPCEQGFHFCRTIADTYKYYPMSDYTRICEVEAIGDVETDDEIKFCTNKIVILREITDKVQKHCNADETVNGFCNTGNWNTGDWNTGYWNTGDWNLCNRSSGIFGTEDRNISFFDKESDWNYDNWHYSRAYDVLYEMPTTMVTWILESDMSDEEKEAYPTYKTTGGYLKVSDKTETRQEWWNGLPEEDKKEVLSLPNFDKQKFKLCTGIEVEEC